MTAQDHQLIADVVKQIHVPHIGAITAARFARRLAVDNPRFDRDKFLAACGYPQAKEGP